MPSQPADAQAQPTREPRRVKADYAPMLVQMPRSSLRVPPGNDNFASALALSTTLPISATVSGFDEATAETGEPDPACKTRDVQTVWFSYTPPANQVVTFDLRGSTVDLDTVAALYTGASVNALTPLACNDDFDLEVLLYPQLKAVALTGGTTYYLQVALLQNAPVAPGASITVEVYTTSAPLNVTVNTTADTRDALVGNGLCADAGGICSLRAAIMEANAALPGSVITIPAGTYTYSIANDLDDNASTDGDLDITEDMTLVGAGPNLTTVNAAGIDGVFQVVRGAVASVSGMTITGGVRSYQGGGVRVDDSGTTLTLDNVVVINNRATEGAGIDIEGGATVVLSNSSVVYNLTPVDGFGSGGGISLYSYIESSQTVVSAVLDADNVTLSNNSARNGGGLSANNNSTANLNFVTVANNRAYDSGGGLALAAESVVAMGRSLVANNTADTGVSPDCMGAYSRFALNLVRSASGCTINVADQSNANPMLRPLELKGPGYTYTHGLLPGSPAIDSVGCAAFTRDQRNVTRPIGAACDLGAAEHDPRVPTAFALITPTDDTVVSDTGGLGAFSWGQSSPGVYGYNLTITALNGPMVVYDGVVRDEACAAGVCSFTPPNLLLPSGYYTWTVTASYDGAGVSPQPNSFAIDPYVAFPNLLVNPGFEQRHTGWVRANITGDAAKCNSDTLTIPTAEGNCAFRFVGRPNESALLRQRIPVDGLGLQANDRLRFSLGYLAGDNNNSVIKLVVTYKLARFTPSVARIRPSNSGGDYAYSDAEILLKDRRVQSVKVVIRNFNTSGRFYVDDLRVIHIPAGQ
jgi:CSLREA domain-containing protein